MQVQRSLVTEHLPVFTLDMDSEARFASVPPVKLTKVPSRPDVPFNKSLSVYVTLYKGPNRLFLRLTDNESQFIDNAIYFIEKERQHVLETSIGTYCMVALPQYSDRQALRARVTDIRRDVTGTQVLADVLYVDEGRVDVVPLHCVYPMSDSEARDPCRSLACCMRRIRPTLESSCYDMQRLVDRSKPYYFDAVFHGLSDGGVYQVDLFINIPDAPSVMRRRSVARLLVDNGFAEFLDYLVDAPRVVVEPTADANDQSQRESEGVVEQMLAERGSTKTENGAIGANEIYIQGDICPESKACTENEICADYRIGRARTAINAVVLDRSPSTLSAINVKVLGKSLSTRSAINGEVSPSSSTHSTISGEVLDKSPSTFSA